MLGKAKTEMISIKTIADECGVSIATVSKALNGHSDVSAETKKLVCETAKSLGYLPNAYARALKTNKTYNIGILLDDKAGSGLTHVFFSSVIDGFRVEAENRGYDITLICGKIGGNSMSYYDHCVYRNVDGILAACVDFYGSDVRELMESEIPMVAIDFKSDRCSSVSSDNSNGIKSLVEYAHECGHEKIAYIYGDSSQVTTTRLNSYLDTMKSLGLQVQPDYLKQGRYLDTILTEKLTNEMLELFDPPTCILVPDDIASIGALNAVKKAGKSVPEDISIAGYDGIRTTQLMTPSLTTFCQDTYEIGSKAADQLIKIMKGEVPSDDYTDTTVCGRLITGNTVKHI